MRYPGIKWPRSPRIVCPSGCAPGFYADDAAPAKASSTDTQPNAPRSEQVRDSASPRVLPLPSSAFHCVSSRASTAFQCLSLPLLACFHCLPVPFTAFPLVLPLPSTAIHCLFSCASTAFQPRSGWSVKQLKAFIDQRGGSHVGLLEKNELVCPCRCRCRCHCLSLCPLPLPLLVPLPLPIRVPLPLPLIGLPLPLLGLSLTSPPPLRSSAWLASCTCCPTRRSPRRRGAPGRSWPGCCR